MPMDFIKCRNDFQNVTLQIKKSAQNNSL